MQLKACKPVSDRDHEVLGMGSFGENNILAYGNYKYQLHYKG
jgi:hypothetical protein